MTTSDTGTTPDPRTTVEAVGDREIVVTRTFDAPPAVVFRAWSEPDLFRRWWVPRSMGMTLESCEMDVRTGGTYRLGFGGDMVFHGTYVEVDPPTRIVWTNDEGADSSVTTVTLTEADGRTLLTVTERFPSAETREADGGAADAMPEVFAQLDELLDELLTELGAG